MTDGQTITLPARGLEELFSSCAVVSVFGTGRKQVLVFTYLCTQSTIQLWCCVSILVLAGNSFWCSYILSVQYSCAVVSVFWLWREIGFGFYILMYLEYNTVVVPCQFFGSGGKQFLVLRMYLVYNSIKRLCQFFGCGRKQISKG